MIFRFGKKQLSDVVKIQQFCEKEGIQFELLVNDLDLQVGESSPAAAAPTPAPNNPAPAEYDPAWEVAKHDGKVCSDKNCKTAYHYFAQVEL